MKFVGNLKARGSYYWHFNGPIMERNNIMRFSSSLIRDDRGEVLLKPWENRPLSVV